MNALSTSHVGECTVCNGGPGVPECVVMTPALSPEPTAQPLLHFYFPLQYSFLLCLSSKNPAMLNNSDTNLQMVENAHMGTEL